MKKTLSIVLLVLLVFLAVACSPEHKHDYQLVESKSVPATCTSNGSNYMECSCGAIDSVPTQMLGHDPVENTKKYIAATCAAEGQRVYNCSRCGLEITEKIAIDPTAHPYCDDKDKGVWDNITKTKTYPTCGSDGLGEFSKCTLCGKSGTYEVVIPAKNIEKYLEKASVDFSSTLNHCKLNEKKDGIVKITEDDVTWNEKKATAFVKGSKNAICPTCGSEFSSTCAGFYNVPVDYDLNDAVGEFRLFASSDSKNYVLKSAVISRTNGFFDADAYTMQYQDGYVTGTAGTLTSDLKITHVEGFTAISGSETKISDDRAFVVTDGSNWYYISQAAVADTGIAVGDYVFGELNGVTGTVEGDDLDFTGATVKTISKVTKSEHVHSFELMKGLGAVVSSGHYLECACGLKYVLQSHDDGCDTCGYTNKWINVTVDNTEDVFVMPLTQGLYVAGPSTSGTASYTYTCFNGKTITYKSVTATNSDEDLSKNGTYYGTAGATLEIALGK